MLFQVSYFHSQYCYTLWCVSIHSTIPQDIDGALRRVLVTIAISLTPFLTCLDSENFCGSYVLSAPIEQALSNRR